MEFCNHPEKGGQMSQKQSASSPRTRILVTSILKWEKKTSLHVEILSLSFIYKPKTKNEMK